MDVSERVYPKDKPVPYTEEQRQKVIELAKAGVMPSDIIRKMTYRFTKGQISGIISRARKRGETINRLGPPKEDRHFKPIAKPCRAAVAVGRTTLLTKAVKVAPMRVLSVADLNRKAPEAGRNPVSLMKAGLDHCRFPVSGEGYRLMYCGDRPQHEGSPYCAAHARVAYNRAYVTRKQQAQGAG